jgi:hypothetical protein
MEGKMRQRIINIEIADICVALQVRDEKVAQEITERYAAFLAPHSAPEATVRVVVREGVQFLSPEPGHQGIDFSFQGGKLVFEGCLAGGSLDMTTGEGDLLMSPGDGHIENFDNFLRVLYAWRCVHHDALLFHATGVAKYSGAFVFPGHSGGGKTTIAHLSLEHTVLSDDMVIVKKTNDVYRAYGVPFYGRLEGVCTNARADLRGIFLLRKDTRHFATALSRPKAVAELLSRIPFVVGDPTTSQRSMDICVDLVASVPVKELHFSRDQGFWRVIDETD